MPPRIWTSDDLVGALIVLRRVQRRAGRRDAERRAAVEAEDVVHLPAADDLREQPAVVQPPAARAERQLGDVGDVQVVRPVEVAERLVQVVVLGDVDPQRAVAVALPAMPVDFDSV